MNELKKKFWKVRKSAKNAIFSPNLVLSTFKSLECVVSGGLSVVWLYQTRTRAFHEFLTWQSWKKCWKWPKNALFWPNRALSTFKSENCVVCWWHQYALATPDSDEIIPCLMYAFPTCQTWKKYRKMWFSDEISSYVHHWNVMVWCGFNVVWLYQTQTS